MCKIKSRLLPINVLLCYFIIYKMELKHILLKHPFTGVVSGPTGSGKTYLVRSLLLNHKHVFANMNKKFKVIWAYGQMQNIYKVDLKGVNIEYIEGLPSEELLQKNEGALVIIDDLMSE